jgi:hypothetical protein
MIHKLFKIYSFTETFFKFFLYFFKAKILIDNNNSDRFQLLQNYIYIFVIQILFKYCLKSRY